MPLTWPQQSPPPLLPPPVHHSTSCYTVLVTTVTYKVLAHNCHMTTSHMTTSHLTRQDNQVCQQTTAQVLQGQFKYRMIIFGLCLPVTSHLQRQKCPDTIIFIFIEEYLSEACPYIQTNAICRIFGMLFFLNLILL